MRADSDYRLHIVKSNWTVRREAPSKLRAAGAQLIKWCVILRFFKTMKNYSLSHIHGTGSSSATGLVADLSVTVCPDPLSNPNTLTHTHARSCCAGTSGPEKPNDQAGKPQVQKKKSSQSVIMLPLAHFIPFCEECFLWLFPCWKNLG